MPLANSASDPIELDDDAPLIRRRGVRHEATFDITAMIDLVFMLNIFFLVTTVAAAQLEMDLPVVRHCFATDADDAVIISLMINSPTSVVVTLENGNESLSSTEPDEQLRTIREAVQDASRSGKKTILLKAERSVKLKDVKRIGNIATGASSEMELRMAVIEKE